MRPRALLGLALLALLALARPAEAQRFGASDIPPRYHRDRVADLTHLALDVRVDVQAGTVGGTSTIQLSLLRPAKTLSLDAADMTIHSVTVGGQPRSFTHRSPALLIDLSEGAAAGDRLTVAIEYTASPRRGMYFVRPDDAYPDRHLQAWTQGETEDNRYWFPLYDFPDDRFTTEVRVTCRKPLLAISNGRRVAVAEADEGWHTFHYEMEQDHVGYLVSLVVGDFIEVELPPYRGEIALPVYVHPSYEADWPRSFERLGEMMAFVEELTARSYPYARYAHVLVSDFRWAGMENITASTLTERTIMDERAALDWSSEALVMHELAHQWFGNLITCRSWPHLWLNEAFATYLETLWIERVEGLDDADLDRMSNLAWYRGESYRRRLAEHRYEHQDDLFDGHTYAKGAWVLHMMRQTLGDALFVAGIRRYVERFEGRVVETSDLRRVMEEVSGVQLQGFFDQWVHRPGHPKLEAEWRSDRAAGAVQLTIRQTQAGAPFELTLPVRISGPTGERTHEVVVTQASETFSLPAPSGAALVEIDPRHDTLMELEVTKPVAESIYQLKHGASVVSKQRAARALALAEAEPAQKKAMAALEEVAKDQAAHSALRVSAVHAIGALGRPASRGLLLALLDAEESRVRRAAASQLGGFDHPDVHRALREAFREDRSYRVASTALTSYQEAGGSDAFGLAAVALGRDSHRDVIREAGIRVLRELGTEEAFRRLIEETAYGKPEDSRIEAIAAIGSLGTKDAANRTRARVRLLALLHDKRYLVRRAAVRALGRLGDKAVVGALKKVRDKPETREMFLEATEAIASLEHDEKAPVGELRRELDDLRKKARELERRIKQLEQR